MRHDLFTCDNLACGKTAQGNDAQGWIDYPEGNQVNLYAMGPSKLMEFPEHNRAYHFCSLDCFVAFIKTTLESQLPKLFKEEK